MPEERCSCWFGAGIWGTITGLSRWRDLKEMQRKMAIVQTGCFWWWVPGDWFPIGKDYVPVRVIVFGVVESKLCEILSSIGYSLRCEILHGLFSVLVCLPLLLVLYLTLTTLLRGFWNWTMADSFTRILIWLALGLLVVGLSWRAHYWADMHSLGFWIEGGRVSLKNNIGATKMESGKVTLSMFTGKSNAHSVLKDSFHN